MLPRMVRALGAFVMSVLVAEPALAEEALSRYALSWVRAEGTEGCPPAIALRTEVERRLGRTVFDPSAERSFEVEVTRFGDKYRSDMFVRGPNGEMAGHRTLESDEPGCGALVDATALAIALVIDPEAASREPPPPRSAGAFEASPAAPVAALKAAPAVAPPLSPLLPPAPPPPPPPPMAPAALDAVTLSLRATLSRGLVPATAPGLELAFALRPARRWGFSVHAEYAPSRNVARGIGSLDVGLTRASALATFRLLRRERLHWAVGAGPSVGAFHVAVREPAPVTAPGDYWFTALQLGTVLQVHVTNRFFLELGAGAALSLSRQQFLVRPQAEPVWSQPRAAASSFFGVGALFP
ncbi:MAG: hypothetical protein K0R38_3035 [Polyangiaceae bacterium]|jgi:hypothetical protein|nr:hypothetical protein [Polyangiaceae bacterium]